MTTKSVLELQEILKDTWFLILQTAPNSTLVREMVGVAGLLT